MEEKLVLPDKLSDDEKTDFVLQHLSEICEQYLGVILLKRIDINHNSLLYLSKEILDDLLQPYIHNSSLRLELFNIIFLIQTKEKTIQDILFSPKTNRRRNEWTACFNSTSCLLHWDCHNCSLEDDMDTADSMS
jgi:hypothetical protein